MQSRHISIHLWLTCCRRYVYLFTAKEPSEWVQRFVEIETNLSTCYRKSKSWRTNRKKNFIISLTIFRFVWFGFLGLAWVCIRSIERGESVRFNVWKELHRAVLKLGLLLMYTYIMCELIIRSNSIEYERVMKILCKRKKKATMKRKKTIYENVDIALFG